MSASLPNIAVLGASGQIGASVASWLAQEGFPVVPMARRFTPAQKSAFGSRAVECSVVDLDAESLEHVFAEQAVDIVVNCIGILQDGPHGRTDVVHRDFVQRLVGILGSSTRRVLLIHLSIPGNASDDATPFSRTKRDAERAIALGTAPFVILRPGFVLAPAAYGGSALMRALSVLPLGLPVREAVRPFMVTDVGDIARTVAQVARQWGRGERDWNAVWHVMAPQPTAVVDVIDALRRHLGGPKPWLSVPVWMLTLAARAGDLAAFLGWSAPFRTNALQEMRRGVAGDPGPWMAATGIEPASLASIVRQLPATVQEKWFARLYLAKPLVLASLALFWILSGLIALTISFRAAAEILTSHGFAPLLAKAITAASSLVDISIGLAIGLRTTCRAGLLAGIGVSLFYMIGAVVLTPEMWIEPLGALVKTGPVIVLMLVALATFEDR